MSQMFVINLIFEARPQDESRCDLVLSLASAAREFLGAPCSLMLLNVQGRQETYFKDDLKPLCGLLSPDTLVSIYPEGGSQEGSIHVQESGGRACYTVSLPLQRLAHAGISTVERLMIALYQAAHAYGEVTLFAGDELEVDASLGGVSDIDFSLMTHFIGPGDQAPWPPEFSLVEALNGSGLYRAPNAMNTLES